MIEQIAREKYAVIEARARALVRLTGMAFADAFAQIKSQLGGEIREKKSAATLGGDAQLANWRSQMTPNQRESLRMANVKGRSENLVEIDSAKDLAIEHLFERSSVASGGSISLGPINEADGTRRRGVIVVPGGLHLRRGQARTAQRLFRYGSCVPAEILGTTSVGEWCADPLAKFRIKAAPATNGCRAVRYPESAELAPRSSGKSRVTYL